jgi:hypothetical protein
MTAGLPGSGIGGLYYFCLVLMMPFRELVWLARGRSSVARWMTIAFYWTLMGAILAAVWGEGLLVSLGIGYLEGTHTWLGNWLLHAQAIRWPMLKFEGEIAMAISFGTLFAVCMLALLAHFACRAGLLKAAPLLTGVDARLDDDGDDEFIR